MNAITDQTAHAAGINLYASPLPTREITMTEHLCFYIYIRTPQLR